ncbi:uncharacterized protein SAPINGB_P000066 [Magnusiomyces paraingens]|uniref:GAF domain-containing protein n=1 Tax=Magnusiomyces paraingens TaxID=2606893 RepID=A0A5E8AYD7_9ASCO|nr:uncharacterized protein SAPINGB_P000066 [Saprochaete ingens]VVT43619.1 unnamed protein product [Saprochaete ingens]
MSEEHHADYSSFSSSSSKEDAYETLILSAKALFVENDVPLPAISNLSNAASLLWHLFQQITPSVNWSGFYLRDPTLKESEVENQQLILGPFQGKVACQLIKFGRGVCGAAAATAKTQLVPNVHEFPGHIACDGDTNSEIVVPIVATNGKVIGVIDIDSTELNSFDEIDKKYLEELASILVELTNWKNY